MSRLNWIDFKSLHHLQNSAYLYFSQRNNKEVHKDLMENKDKVIKSNIFHVLRGSREISRMRHFYILTTIVEQILILKSS